MNGRRPPLVPNGGRNPHPGPPPLHPHVQYSPYHNFLGAAPPPFLPPAGAEYNQYLAPHNQFGGVAPPPPPHATAYHQFGGPVPPPPPLRAAGYHQFGGPVPPPPPLRAAGYHQFGGPAPLPPPPAAPASQGFPHIPYGSPYQFGDGDLPRPLPAASQGAPCGTYGVPVQQGLYAAPAQHPSMQHGQYAAPEAAPPQHGPYAAPVQHPPVQYSSVQYSSVPSVQHSSMQHAPAVINKHQQSPPAAVLAYQNQPQQFGLEKEYEHGVEKEYEHGVEQSALQEKAETSRKRHLEDEEGFLNPKRMLKQPEDNEDSEEYICLWDFLAKNPCKPYTFGAGSSLGSIPPDKSINLAPLPVRLCSDGFIQEVSLAHEQNLSWAGQFNEKNMLVRKKGPLCVKIAVQPKFEATDQNVDLDYLQIVKMLLSKIGEVGNRPPYFGNLILRIQELPTLHEDDREVGIWLIRNHPANLGSPKNRICMEEFYIFYNTLPVNQRGKFMESVRTNSSERWHLSTVPRDEYLTDFYWIKGNHQRPTDFRVESYVDTQKLKFLEGVSLEEQELITAYYFEAFFPEFLGKFFSLRTKHRMRVLFFLETVDLLINSAYSDNRFRLAELIETYVSRSSVAMRAYE